MKMEDIEEFLRKNSNDYEKLEISIINNSFDISEDDEVYFFQCPKDFDITTLKNTRIKVPGKTILNSSELITENCSPIKSTFVIPDQQSNLKLKCINIQGKMVLRKRIEIKKSEEDIGGRKQKFRVPFPQDIKERHPLHGVCYKEKINLAKHIKDRLKEAEKSRVYDKSDMKITPSAKKKKQKSEVNESNFEKNEDVHKKIKIEFDDNDESLNWLRNI
ncbi:uncharacterized protein LOC129612059 [Condylostylus longicornis]|uniref:uncharacterized protein LOC129612059 n=1 Tax=Condylostylus longicornis TaxID=2530218 RepID=UPI00244DB78D|nr:uncharacterized protein LOC129612059 [Condylostylus longicornis]